MACFSMWYLHQYLPLPVYEVPAIRVNTTKSTYTFTNVFIIRSLESMVDEVAICQRATCIKGLFGPPMRPKYKHRFN